MAYLLKNSLRLQIRDTIFRGKYLKEKISQLGKSKRLIICNSYPKSGTHLLYQILRSIPDLEPWDDIVSVQALCGIMNNANHVRWKIGSAPDGSIVRSHLMCCDEILDILAEHRCKLLFIYRDLRDVAVSHARWVTKEERIFLHDIYNQEPDFDQQLMKSIKGVPLGSPFGSNLSQPDIGQDFRRWQGWLSHPETLAIRFEDLVGERGGGSEDKRLYIVEQIMDHLGVSLPPQDIRQKFSSHAMNPQESHTYRKGGKGSLGGWKKYFNQNHKQAFKAVAGDLLVELHYEADQSW
ncbi:sulfotransferase [filamentous cyanobacterium CCP5]|nr:sulfotransferase [filamentous cyanobacterium CCP5]